MPVKNLSTKNLLRKLIKDVWWTGWVWVGECFFWYRPTRVVPDKGPLNSSVCVKIYWYIYFHVFTKDLKLHLRFADHWAGGDREWKQKKDQKVSHKKLETAIAANEQITNRKCIQMPGSEHKKLPSSGTICELTRENGTTVFTDSSDRFLYNTLKPISIPSVTKIHLHITQPLHQHQ